MPEYWAVRCFNCKAFVNQQKKKAKKWKCPICGSKQSVKRIYGTSDRSKDIRELIVKLNTNRAEYDREEQETKQEMNEYLEYHNMNNLDELIEEETEKQKQRTTTNRWREFEDNKQENNDKNNDKNNDEEDDGMYVLQIPEEYKKKRGRGRKRKNNKYIESAPNYESIEPPIKKMKINHNNNGNIKDNDDDEWNWDVWGNKNDQNDQSENNKNGCKSFRNRFIGNYQKNDKSEKYEDKYEDEERFCDDTRNDTVTTVDILLGGDIDDNKNNTNHNQNIEITLESQQEIDDKSNIYQTDITENDETTSKWSEYL